MDPVPSIFPAELMQTPSCLPTPQTSRNPPRKRIYQEDELEAFQEKDVISSLDDINESIAPPGFQFKRSEDNILFFNIVIDEKTQFPSILESIKVDRDLHVQLQYNGIPLPLPQWFVKGCTAKLNRISMLLNLSSYIRNIATENHYSILDELKERQLYRPQGRPPYSLEVIRYALHLRYTSLQAYRLVLDKFPMPSISLLNKIQQGGVNSLKALQLLCERGELSNYCIMMVDEMYLQKATQYQGSEYVGADKDGHLYKGIVAFMVVGLKQSIPYVIQAIPEVSFTGKWLSERMAENIHNLIQAGFCVRGIVTDNHSANINAFSSLVKTFNSESNLDIEHAQNHGKKTYLFYDSVHLVKNIRNNLLNGKKFVFPKFIYNDDLHISVHCPAGYISWGDLYNIYDRDKELSGNLRKAPKLSYQALHPCNNKQNVPLALAVIDETTIAAAKSYYSNRPDIAGFLSIFNKWWTIANSKQRFCANVLGNAIVSGDKKTDFYRALADWIEQWCQSPHFTLTAQTASSLTSTLRSHAILIDELVNEGYSFVMTSRLQSDPIEKRFSQYRQMSGGRFLVSLREVLNSERILSCRSLIKKNINFWEENIQVDQDKNVARVLNELFNNRSEEIIESVLDNHSTEVAITISGYVARKLTKRSKCEDCKTSLIACDNDIENDSYLSLLSRGGLFVPSKSLAEFVCTSFAILDYIENDILATSVPVRKATTYVLQKYGPTCEFTCEEHKNWGFVFATKIVINIFYNNKQKLAADSVRKDAVCGFKKRHRDK